MKIDTSKIDVAAVFLGFVACVGDIQKTSLMFDLDPSLVERLAAENEWTDKIKRLSLVSKDSKGNSEWAVCQNRALSYVQGHMLRSILQKVLESVGGMGREDLTATVTAVKAGSVTYTARFYADLSAAMASAHSLCYQALGDAPGDRKEVAAGDGDGLDSLAKLHAAVNLALSNPAAAGAERRLLENEIINIPKE